jgi:hypothetical protein
MQAIYTKIVAWQYLRLLVLMAVFLLILVSATSGTALAVDESLKWATICHWQPGQTGPPQEMTLYWSAVDKCLSFFGDTFGPCPQTVQQF